MAQRGSSGKARRCNGAVDTADPALPVAGTRSLAHVRKSANAKRRALVLLAVHLLIAAHATHFLIAGRTLSPVEPSEAMYTIELGQVNAGFVFLLTALVATLLFGRFVCGWGCHIIAVQDVCGWIMKRLGVRPRPFRSRLLIWAPLAVALYMFVWPTVKRLVFETSAAAFPGFSNHLVTTGFWKTFPGPLFAVLTFASCGFAAVYFLGSKGFCTYGCPYGGLFGVVDRLSPGRIVVDDACEQCGHCTVTCTSNVLVHEEVRRYGQVVDPGCMKCMDCVSVCPKGALSYSWGKPSLWLRPADRPRVRRYPLGLVEELTAAAVCLGSTFAFRGLYDGPPLLMSVALGGITAFLAVKLWHLWRKSDVPLQNLWLKRAGRTGGAGRVFAGLAGLWILFAAHSAFVQWHRVSGRHWLNRTDAGREEVLSGALGTRNRSPEHERAVARSLRHFSLAERWGLVGVVEVKLGLAWNRLLRGESEPAERALRQAVGLAPADPHLHDHLIELLQGRGRVADATRALERKLAAVESTAQDHFRLAGLLVQDGRLDDAVEQYATTVAMEPEAFEARYNFGGLLRRLERHEEAIGQLEAAERLAPTDADTQIELGLAYMAIGESDAAVVHLRSAIALDPDSPESRMHLPGLIRELERPTGDP
jgi:tetratricopeptide (TPR) repeat protein/ferredoxin